MSAASFHFLVGSKSVTKPSLLKQADSDLAQRATPGIWTSLGFLPILAFATNYAAEHPVVLTVFTVTILLLTAARLILATKKDRFETGSWRYLVSIVFSLTGLAWGSFVPVTFYLYGHKGIEGLLSVIWLAGSCPAMIAILAPHLVTMRFYLIAAMVPGILGELFLIQDAQPAVAVMLAVFLLYMLEQGNTTHVSYWKNAVDSELLKIRATELEGAKAEAEHANRAKSDLLAKVTEEIRQPLYDIIGLSAGLLDAELPAEPVHQLRNVKFSADSLLHRVSDLHDYARLESGEIELEVGPFHIQEVVGMALKALKPAADAKGLIFHAHIDEEVPRKVEGDAWRLQQLLTNVVSNAIKFTEEGEVAVDIRLDSWQGRDACVLFVISDTGRGIHPEDHEIIFQAFSRGSSGGAGSGLGLPIAAKIAKLTGGRIWIESEVGRGTKVYCTTRLQTADPSLRPRFRTLPVVA
jgi:signal transduction histidine kinase